MANRQIFKIFSVNKGKSPVQALESKGGYNNKLVRTNDEKLIISVKRIITSNRTVKIKWHILREILGRLCNFKRDNFDVNRKLLFFA